MKLTKSIKCKNCKKSVYLIEDFSTPFENYFYCKKCVLVHIYKFESIVLFDRVEKKLKWNKKYNELCKFIFDK